VKEAMGHWQFWLLWAMLFLNVSAGIMIISQASPMVFARHTEQTRAPKTACRRTLSTSSRI
jgi:hypothetical protein